jgi:hypothetical protein
MYKALYVEENKIKYKNKEYKLNIAFDRMLKAIDLSEDETLGEIEKVEHMFECFIDDKVSLNIYDKGQIVNKVFTHLNSFFENKKSGKNEKVMDIKQDFQYIYSSFYKDYNIDLLEQFGKLSWIKFIALLNGLSKDTKLSEVIRIRTTEIPKPTKDNHKYRQSIIEQKNFYALEQKKEDFQEGLNDLFHILSGMAKK